MNPHDLPPNSPESLQQRADRLQHAFEHERGARIEVEQLLKANKLVTTSHTLEDLCIVLQGLLERQEISVDSLTLLRKIRGPNLGFDLMHLVEADGVYAKYKGGVFVADETLSGLAFKTESAQYAMDARLPHNILIPEDVNQEASEYAIPLLVSIEDEPPSLRAVLHLRRERVDAFSKEERATILKTIESVKESLASRLGRYETIYSYKCQTLYSPRGQHHIKNLYRSAVREHLPFSLAFLDIDYFARLNEQYGHPKTDDILFIFGETLRSHLRASDIIVHYGGDEFIIGLKHATGEDAAHRLDAVREAVKNLSAKYSSLPGDLDLGFCAGIVSYETHATNQHGVRNVIPTPEYRALRDLADQTVEYAKRDPSRVKNRTAVWQYGSQAPELVMPVDKNAPENQEWFRE